jgi:N-glycosylase/DNA lyase
MKQPLSITLRQYDCQGRPLNLSLTLASGQSFRWRRDAADVWWGVIGQTVVALWQARGQPGRPLHWQTFPQNDRWDIVADYFRLDVDLDALYADWTKAEPRIADAVAAFRGLRILRQPPEECFFAFQCATCNTLTRIERSVHKLAARYGERIDLVSCAEPFLEGKGWEVHRREPAARSPSDTNLPGRSSPPSLARNERAGQADAGSGGFHAFPTLDMLADADETVLRADLWGYRAPRVIALARHLQSLPSGWLGRLRDAPYAEARAALMALDGVGAKLADCVCLFALDKDEAVPVDTHVRQIACRLFLPEMEGRTLTPRVYDALADAYRARFGPYAGWAQQYLFFGELHRARNSSTFPNSSP